MLILRQSSKVSLLFYTTKSVTRDFDTVAIYMLLTSLNIEKKMLTFICRISNLTLCHNLFNIQILICSLNYLIFTVIICRCLLLAKKNHLQILYEKEIT